jgi:hypothetical protein
LFWAVVVTLVGFHVLIFAFCVASYRGNQEESLRGFEVVWMIGFFWTFLFKWPYSIRSIFYLRTRLLHAETVCIFTFSSTPESLASIKQQAQMAKQKMQHKDSQRDPIYIALLRHAAHLTVSCVNNFMARLFSMPARGNGRMQYVPVLTDRITGTRYFIFEIRRYNYDYHRVVVITWICIT